jgi:O-antigen/teichoic acid export membrane protein
MTTFKKMGPGLIALAIKVAGAGLSYVMFVALARLLSPEEYGRFAFGLNLAIIFAALGGMGFSVGIMRYWPKYLVDKDYAGAKGVVLVGFGAALVLGLVVTLAAIIVSTILDGFNIATALAVGLLGLAIAWGDYSSNLLRGQGSVVVSMLPRDVLWRIFTPLGAYFILKSGFGLTGTTTVLVCAIVLLVLTAWQGWLIWHNVVATTGAIEPRFDFSALKESLVPLWVSSIVYALIQQFDVVIVGTLMTKADAGAYFAAQKTAALLGLVVIAGGMVTAPTMAALYHAKKLSELQSLCRNLAMAIAAVTLAGFVFLAFTGKILLGLFDANFVSAYPILMIIAFGSVIDAISGPNAYLMQMSSYEKPYVKIMLVCYACVVTAQVLLIPRYGMLGAALASSAGVILWNISAIYILRTRAGLDTSLLSIAFPPRPTDR